MEIIDIFKTDNKFNLRNTGKVDSITVDGHGLKRGEIMTVKIGDGGKVKYVSSRKE